MTPVISFRATPEEADEIERTRRAHGFKTRAQAVRHLIRQGARQGSSWRNDPLFRFRFDEAARKDEDITSRDIDRELYGRD